MIEFKCQACGKFLKLPQAYAGKMTECPACRKMTRVPGAPSGGGPVAAPKSSAPGMQLCVDCGGSFPTGQMMQHNGQAVCTNCYYKRKPVQLKQPGKPARRRKVLIWLGIGVGLAAIAAVVSFLATC